MTGPTILIVAVCTGCGATGTLNAVDANNEPILGGQHGETCAFFPLLIGSETNALVEEVRNGIRQAVKRYPPQRPEPGGACGG